MQGKIPLPDEQPVAVNALRNKRAQIAGMIAMHEGEARQLRAELIHIDAVLRLFDPETDPEGLPISKAFPRRMAYFAKGEVSRRVYDALRDGTTAAAGRSDTGTAAWPPHGSAIGPPDAAAVG